MDLISKWRSRTSWIRVPSRDGLVSDLESKLLGDLEHSSQASIDGEHTGLEPRRRGIQMSKTCVFMTFLNLSVSLLALGTVHNWAARRPADAQSCIKEVSYYCKPLSFS